MPFFRKSRFPIFGRDTQSKNLSDIRFAFNIRAALKPKADPSSLPSPSRANPARVGDPVSLLGMTTHVNVSRAAYRLCVLCASVASV